MFCLSSSETDRMSLAFWNSTSLVSDSRSFFSAVSSSVASHLEARWVPSESCPRVHET